MSFDGDAHESRRNVMLGVGLSVVAVVLVGGMFWVMSSLSRPVITGTATAATTSSSATTDAAAAPAPPTTTAAAPPTVGTWTNTVTLPPGEQPTMTAPVAAPSVDAPPAAATSAPAPAPAPKTTQAPPPPATTPPAQAAPSVTNVNLGCKKDSGRKITATLTFTTTTRVDVVLAPGGMAQRTQAGPGDVSLNLSARGADLCYAQVAGQMVGPVPAT